MGASVIKSLGKTFLTRREHQWTPWNTLDGAGAALIRRRPHTAYLPQGDEATKAVAAAGVGPWRGCRRPRLLCKGTLLVLRPT